MIIFSDCIISSWESDIPQVEGIYIALMSSPGTVTRKRKCRKYEKIRFCVEYMYELVLNLGFSNLCAIRLLIICIIEYRVISIVMC